MKLPGLIVASLSLFGAAVVRGADATAPIDYTQRNTPFAPAATVTPEKKDLPRAESVQDKRVEITTVEKKSAAIGDRRAAIMVEEARDKNIREKNSSRPEVLEQPMSAFNHRDSAITTSGTKKPPVVAKYQDSLSAANAIKVTRSSASDSATTAKIIRFVFRKNSTDSDAVTADAAVRPAGGANPIRK